MQYSGVVDAVKRMLADEGIAGFYKGEPLSPRALGGRGFNLGQRRLPAPQPVRLMAVCGPCPQCFGCITDCLERELCIVHGVTNRVAVDMLCASTLRPAYEGDQHAVCVPRWD